MFNLKSYINHYYYHRDLDEIVKLLNELRVWQTVEIRGGIDGWLLNPTFRKNLKGALLSGYFYLNLLKKKCINPL